MQWDRTKNMGFSSAESTQIYLPVDGSVDAPCVADQEKDPDSLLNEVKRLTALRAEYEDLQAAAPFRAIRAGGPDEVFVYGRGDMVLAINTSSRGQTVEVPEADGKKMIYSIGSCSLDGKSITVPAQSFAVLK